MNAIRGILLGLVLLVSGFAGAQSFASESPPLVANCVNAADGWAVEVFGLDCVRAGAIIDRLVEIAPRGPKRLKGMTCTVGYVGKLPVSIRCTASRGRFLRANAYLQQGKTPPALRVARCPDYVDKANRRWAIRHERFGCREAAEIVSELATDRVDYNDRKYVAHVSAIGRMHDADCGASPSGGLPRLISCNGFTASRAPLFRGFRAEVKLVDPPSTNGATTTVRRR